MTDLNDFFATDGITDVLAEYVNDLIAGNLRGELTNTQTLTGDLTLNDASFQIQNLTPSGADRNVLLPPEAGTNHLFVFRNVSGTYKLVIKDDSGVTTFISVSPGQTVAVVPVGGSTWTVLGGATSGREVLTAARTYYVRTDGSNSNTGLVDSAGGAFLTIQKAIDTVAGLDLSIYDVTIQVKDGTYSGANTLKSLVGSGKVIIQGNNATPANVLISVTSNNCFTATSVLGTYSIRDLKMATITSGSCIYVVASYVESQGCDFGTTVANHIVATNIATLQFTGNYTISGSAGGHWLASGYGNITRSGALTVTLTGTPAFATFATAQIESVITAAGFTFSGSATGKRYDVSTNSTIYNPSSETFFPGNALGTRSSGGQYGTFVGETRVTTQFDKTNTTLADITGLSVNVLAGRTYRFKAVLYTTSNSASGVKAAIAGTATATNIIYYGQTADVSGGTAIHKATALGTAVGNVTAVTGAMIIIHGTITVNAAGTLTVQFADNAGTNTSSVLVGSTFEVVDIP